MRYLILACLISASINTPAQLRKGDWLLGVQTTVINGDLYQTHPSFPFGRKGEWGVSAVPSAYYSLLNNWVVGLETHIGYMTEKLVWTGIEVPRRYFDLGIAPVSRYYIDLIPSGRFKIYGFAGWALRHGRVTDSYPNGKIRTNINDDKHFLGAGLAYAAPKWMLDVNGSVLGLRLGVYRYLKRR